MYKTLLIAVFGLVANICSAYDFSAVSPSGHTLYYNINENGTEVTLTSEMEYNAFESPVTYNNPYTGDLVIPESVTYKDKTYKVTAIGQWGLGQCPGLTNVTIPSTVTSIGMLAFCRCSGLRNLVIPSTVTSIGNQAFYYVRHVEYQGPAEGAPWLAISLNGYVEGDFAYKDATKTQLDACLDADSTATIPESVTKISDYAFSYLPKLVSIEIPNSVDSVGYAAFMGCENLESATFPSHIKRLEGYLFRECVKLKSFVVPDSVSMIGQQAFSFCHAMTEVTLGYSVKRICIYAFNRCYNLKNIHSLAPVAPEIQELSGGSIHSFTLMPDSVVVGVPGGSLDSYKATWSKYFDNIKEEWNPKYNVFDYTYKGHKLYYRLKTDTIDGVSTVYAICSYPTMHPTTAETIWDGFQKPVGDVEVPASVEFNGQRYPVCDFGRCAFVYCDSVTSVTIPEGVFKVGNYSLAYCPRLKSVKFPSTVKEMDWHVFRNDSALVSVNIPASMTSLPTAMFMNCTGLQSIEIPEGVTRIAPDAFHFCGALKSVKLPESLTEIGGYAFSECYKLEKITLGSTTPPTTDGNVFTVNNATLFVPAGTADLYRQHAVWGLFPQIVENTTGVETAKANGVNICVRNGRIVVEGADGEKVQVFNMKGQQVPAGNQPLSNGIYLVKVGDRPVQKTSVF